MAWLSAGALNRRITIQEIGSTKDSHGQKVNTWVPVSTVWANIDPISGSEKLRAMSVGSEISVRVGIRYQPEFSDPLVMAKRRVVYGTRIFNIVSSRNISEAGNWIVLDCTEGSVNGQ
jgi:SPP1 family predicted phage head-tail adaptor